MREGLDQWLFVYATYVLAIGATLAMIAASWLAMRAAERRRDGSRGK